jgi:hypothetical protein
MKRKIFRNETKSNEKKIKGKETERNETKGPRNETKKKLKFFKLWIELTTNNKGTLAPASSHSLHFNDEVGRIWLQKMTSPNQNLERNMFIS